MRPADIRKSQTRGGSCFALRIREEDEETVKKRRRGFWIFFQFLFLVGGLQISRLCRCMSFIFPRTETTKTFQVFFFSPPPLQKMRYLPLFITPQVETQKRLDHLISSHFLLINMATALSAGAESAVVMRNSAWRGEKVSAERRCWTSRLLWTCRNSSRNYYFDCRYAGLLLKKHCFMDIQSALLH